MKVQTMMNLLLLYCVFLTNVSGYLGVDGFISAFRLLKSGSSLREAEQVTASMKKLWSEANGMRGAMGSATRVDMKASKAGLETMRAQPMARTFSRRSSVKTLTRRNSNHQNSAPGK
ncbi:uncharacterized protein PGTG_07856 [Puccinia graminis f. sp. tritici CRL 75-36-700-3]|uniref:Uncharacterized protein n=1 Tax=Puccinia graminis f. sp. tritici (strain CRL 75-36-700-3 / race SCCL) TaxID=418459 RepID=E3KB94_PUCGT|nr:uncharacterized protein PGTG_07856 [Puccinia graminis f. sp. tritici CRL 75-36-700-3]EFP81607.2 hypothetical protein PGTG_07856 [Puccinia graminis f. sp. tritici CRL 75-36-700-3]